MATVDDKIVSMKFDNATFEQRLAETIKSLDKLNQTIANAGAVNGLKDIGAAANNVNLGPLQSGVEGISAKFLALSTIAVTALATITSKAINAGTQIAKSLTIQPILEGFREYETNMNSIQTILANTKADGSTLADVNKALDQLNQYSDQTIYNFSEMARNIGTFTAAGVGLDQSVNAIKGIANLAAISGSNSQQASTAMYQLSQALAAGKVNLMDWNSVVNAGMGGEVFKKALFETGKAMKTITDVPLGASFEEWEKKGGTFREQMQKGWLTADVLSTTLEAFSGDLDVAGLKALGFSDAAAQQMVELGELGQAAATEVKTFTQLMSTIKESVASGWSQSFRTVLGDFEEAKALFTEISNAVGGMVDRSADARNAMLKDWKDLGGREALIQSFRNIAQTIGNVIGPIKEAFRDLFPAKTGQDLMNMTLAFSRFTAGIRVFTDTHGPQIKSIFSGIFSVIKIGVEIIKGVATVFGDLIGTFSGAGSGALDFAANTGDMLTKLQETLVAGGHIRVFFDKISHYVQKAAQFVKAFVGDFSVLTDLFSGFSGTEAVEAGISGVNAGMSRMSGIVERVTDGWAWLMDRLSGVGRFLQTIAGHISTWFGELKDKLINVFQPGDFDAAVDIVNVGLLGGIALMIKRFMDGGILNMLGGGNILENIAESFQNLTGALQAMQADVKAKALMKIAIAVGVLTASLLVLSMINSEDLAKALVAVTIAMGQLMAAMAIMDKINMTTGPAKMVVIATGMILIATAATILSLAIKNLSSLGWEELAKGLIGVGVGLGIMITGMNMLTTNTAGLIRAGIGMVAISVGLMALSMAVESFSDMSWGEMAKGMVGVGVGLAILVGAMNLMPTSGMIQAGVGLIAISGGLIILAHAVQSFADISWGDMAKGFLGVGAGLVIIAGAMRLMPSNMVATAAGLLILSVALNVMASAIAAIGNIPFGELAKGIGGLAVMLGILAIAMNAMNGTAAGAGALLVVSGALVVLTGVLKTLGKMKLEELAIGLGAIAAVFVVLGVGALALSPVVPVLFSLGVALGLIGGAFVLFGVGAMAMAKAFELIAKTGKAGLGVLIEAIEMVIGALPKFVAAFLQSIVNLAVEIGAMADLLVRTVAVLVGHILEAIAELAPQIAETAVAIISSLIEAVTVLFPQLVELGITIITTILTGIRDNIYQLVTLGTEIIVNLVSGLVANMATLVNAAVNLITSFLFALSQRAADLVAGGLALLTSLINGISNNMHLVINAVQTLITTFLFQITSAMGTIIEYGVNLLVWLMKGISDNLSKVIDAVAEVITTFINDIGARAKDIIDAGFGVLTDLLQGIGDNLRDVVTTAGNVISEFITAVGDAWLALIDAGFQVLEDFLQGISDNITDALDTGREVVEEIMEGATDNVVALADAAFRILTDFLNELADVIERRSGELRAAGRRLAGAIADGVTGGWASRAKGLVDMVGNTGGSMLSALGSVFKINSPSKAFMAIGASAMEGLTMGVERDSDDPVYAAEDVANNITKAFEDIVSRISDTFDDMQDLNPVVTPVLDLSNVQSASRGLSKLIESPVISPTVSLQRANTIATTADLTGSSPDSQTPSGPTEVTFEQNIYSPTPLSTNDIYRNTKSQIALAKEELNI